MRYLLFRNKFTRKLILIGLFIILIFFSADNYFSDTVKMYTKQRAYLHSSMIIEQSVRESIVERDVDEIVDFQYKDGGLISNVSVNTSKANGVLVDVLKSLTTEILEIEDTDVDNLKIPLGYLVSDTLFANFGPKVTIGLKPIGSVYADIISSVTPTGINNSLLEVVLETNITFMVLIPMQRQEIVVTTRIPLVIEVLNGEIPRYYYQGGGSSMIPPEDDSSPEIEMNFFMYYTLLIQNFSV